MGVCAFSLIIKSNYGERCNGLWGVGDLGKGCGRFDNRGCGISIGEFKGGMVTQMSFYRAALFPDFQDFSDLLVLNPEGLLTIHC